MRAQETRGTPAPSPTVRLVRLDQNGPFKGSLDLGKDQFWQDFSFECDSRTYGVEFALQGSAADLDLRILDDQGREVTRVETGEYNERLFFYRGGTPALKDGSFILRVGYFVETLPFREGRAVHALDFGLSYRQVRVDTVSELPLDQVVQDFLSPEAGMLRSYHLSLEPGQEFLRLDTFNARSDLDVFIFPQAAKADPMLANWMLRSYRSREYLVLDLVQVRQALPDWDGREMGVLVLSALDQVDTPFSIQASTSPGVPPQLLDLPAPSGLAALDSGAAQGRLGRGLSATVEILGARGGGSGCVLSAQGFILTNWHVVAGLDGEVEPEVAVGFTLDPRQAAESLFKARVIRFDKGRDLALLQIVSGYYGQALPPGYRFPFMEIRRPGGLDIGTVLSFSGYPALGGLGSRSTITLTRGIVSGFEDRGRYTLLKTDATISPGNSGGAALDDQGRLVGIPTVIQSDRTAQMAWIYPADMLPADWYGLMGLEPVRSPRAP